MPSVGGDVGTEDLLVENGYCSHSGEQSGSTLSN